MAWDAGRGRTDSEGAGREQRRDVRALAPDAASHGTDTDAAGLRPRDHHTSAAAVELRSRRGGTSQKSDAREKLARRQDLRRLVAPRRARRALGAVCTSDTVFTEMVVAPRPLRDRGLRPDGGQARAVVGDAARRLPRGLVRGPRPPNHRRLDGVEADAMIQHKRAVKF